MEEKKPLSVTRKSGAFLLAVLSSFGIIVPTIGFFYYFGYLGAFGLDNNIFPTSLWDLWKYSFHASYDLALGSIKYLFIILLITTVLAFSLVYLLIFSPYIYSLDKKGWIPQFLKKEIKIPFASTDLTSNVLRWLFICLKLLIMLLITIALLFGAFIALVKFGALGEAKGKEYIAKYKQSGCPGERWSYCIDYTNPNNSKAKSYSGLLVAASSTHIAIFDGGSVSVIPRNPEYVLTRGHKIIAE